ncbi:MAG: hypothetical protein CME05_13585 [Gemmatimonadaceae bacterium]|nr:hypothetical protein [Gemmatimonadaceae bacterium]
MIGALLAKYYFWPRYGTQQWRQYAMVLAVGFGVGISLVGMVCLRAHGFQGSITDEFLTSTEAGMGQCRRISDPVVL